MRLITLFFMLALAACASSGTAFEWEKARQVTIGATESELIALMGKPNSVVTRGDSQTWIWVYAEASPLGVNSRRVSFPMKDGKVTALPNLAQF